VRSDTIFYCGVPESIAHEQDFFAAPIRTPGDRLWNRPGCRTSFKSQHHWPGNIRELQNFIERSVILTQGPVLSPRTTELKLLMQAAMSAPSQTLSDAERTHILGILKETNWIVGGRDGAAARLGVPRTTLISRMQKLGISSRPGGFPLEQARSGPQLLAS
jgi:hypothetical protein